LCDTEINPGEVRKNGKNKFIREGIYDRDMFLLGIWVSYMKAFRWRKIMWAEAALGHGGQQSSKIGWFR